MHLAFADRASLLIGRGRIRIRDSAHEAVVQAFGCGCEEGEGFDKFACGGIELRGLLFEEAVAAAAGRHLVELICGGGRVDHEKE